VALLESRDTGPELSNYLFFTTLCEPALRFYEQRGLGRITDRSTPVTVGGRQGSLPGRICGTLPLRCNQRSMRTGSSASSS